MPRIAAFRRLRQEDGELQARLGCIVRPRLRNNQNLQANHQLLVCPHLREREQKTLNVGCLTVNLQCL